MTEQLQEGSADVGTMTGAAESALRAGDATKARLLLEEALGKAPGDPGALTMMAWALEQDGRPDEATPFLRRAVAADSDLRRRYALALHLRRYVSPDLAIQEIEAIPEAARKRGRVGLLYANALGQVGKHAEELATYDEMLRLEPRNASIWVNFGYALKTVGRTGEAVRAVKRAIQLSPMYGRAYWALANFKTYAFTTDDLRRMRDMVAQNPPIEEALHIHFALGKACEDAEQYEQSFRHYAAANGLRAATLDPSEVAITGKVDDLIEHCSRDVFARAEGGCQAADPIFIVGLHRSGSTLIEQILASHPLIEGTGELKVMLSLGRRLHGSATGSWGQAIAALEPADLVSLGEEYLERAKAFRRTDRPYFIDKLPANWINIPLIRMALPRAKIIDARRHPMACGFSNFKQNYAAGVAHSYRLSWMGEFYRDYWRFMRHIHRHQPGAVYTLINERLVEDPEGETRKMLDFVGVPPAQSCFEFHKNDRAVRTPSAEQVRRPVNREGFDRWRCYEPWLGELKSALGDSLHCWEN